MTQKYNFTMYILQMNNTNNYKIGITKNLKQRLTNLQTGNPNILILVGCWWHNNKIIIQKYERVLHRYFTKIKCRTETQEEWFILNVDQVNEILQQSTIAEQNKYIENILKRM